jgi:hypothetical protein
MRKPTAVTRRHRSLSRWLCVAVALGTAAVVAATITPTAATPSARAACGVELWSLKTLSDPLRYRVNLHPRNTSVAAINRQSRPYPTPTTRNTAYERRAYRVAAQIVQFKLEEDSDIHLILFWGGRYMIAEMPFAGCLPQRTRDRRAIVAARNLFVRRCGFPTTSWQSLGAVAYISGVGFWDIAHGQRGAARNYAELHPVTGLRFVAGCA